MMNRRLYIEKDTFLHRLDPRTKTISLFVFFLISLVVTDLFFLLAISLLLLLLIIYAGATENLLHAGWLIVVISCMCILFWLPARSFIYGVIVALRLDVMFFAGILFVSCGRVEEFSTGLNKIGMPYRIAFSISLAFILIPNLFGIIQNTVEAQQARGLDVKKGNVLQRAKKYIPLFIPVISLLVRDAHHLSMALESKGFGFKRIRTEYIAYRMRLADYITLGLLLFILLASI